ncbi:MAG: hypothetical protein P1P87_12350, partial [Trueperaceae bacterium]|nr:hypothetical protein [Trueperaceae bacterium]
MRRWIALHPTVPAIVYFVAAVVWIAASDRLAQRMWPDPDAFARVQTLKGWAFVAFSALLIATTSLRQQRLRQRLEHEKQAAEERALGGLPGATRAPRRAREGRRTRPRPRRR